MLDSTNCIRGDIPVNSNLRDFNPSKLMKITADGNCLFTSLSYWLTGNVDHSSLIRLKIVDNMVGKLKDECNKCIVNKFPKSAINYRNVSDDIVKSSMRRNYTWGTLTWNFSRLSFIMHRTDNLGKLGIGNKYDYFLAIGAKLMAQYHNSL